MILKRKSSHHCNTFINCLHLNLYCCTHDFQDSPDDEEDTRSSQEYLNDLEEEYQARALLAKSKSSFFFFTFSKQHSTQIYQSFSAQTEMRPNKDFEAKYNKDEEVSSDDNEVIKVKVLMALADDERVVVGKKSARNGELVKISMKKVLKDPTSEYDSADESSFYSTPLPPLEKLVSAEPISGPKTIKLILKSNSTFKVEALKDVTINDLSSAHAKAKASVSKTNSALAGKLKNVKTEDDIPLASCNIRKTIWYLNSGCLRHMIGVKSYLPKYEEWPGPKVVFGDDSTCTTKGYGSIKCNGIVFTKLAFVNGLKYNLISISQLCDAKYIVQFDEKRGAIFNFNKEIVMIAPRLRDVYVLDMTSSAQESCFFAKAF
ncbi:hypothetical protein Tco_0639621 [Tanacetum coccineum]